MRFVVAVAAFLAVWNNLANLLPAFQAWYVLVNLVVAIGLILAARRRGYSWATLGLSRARAGAGLRWGLGALIVVAAVLLAAAAVPATRPLLADQRVAGMTGAQLAYLALVRIPLGTVVLEETAFRGVLLGVWAQAQGQVPAVVGSSVVFGVWHLVPTLALLDVNALATDPLGRAGALAGAVAVTGVAGAVLSVLRLMSGSVLAPALAHVASNSLSALAAFVVAGSR